MRSARSSILVLLATSPLFAAACADSLDTPPTLAQANEPGPSRTGSADADTPQPSVDAGVAPDGAVPAPQAPYFFSVAYVEDHQTASIPGQDLIKGGDLWPSCWSDDDALYSANGDGIAFGGNFDDIVVSRITGSPEAGNMAGTSLARTDALGKIWTPKIDNNNFFNRKPTGMFCADGAIFLAIQDLRNDFNEAPAASISVSYDHGKTWVFDKNAPMFSGHIMTTLMFLDYGKDNEHAIDDNAYVYGLDQNWRFSTRVPSPTKLWLARVPKTKIRDRSAWTYYAGLTTEGQPMFDTDIDKRVPVLEDDRTVYTTTYEDKTAKAMHVVSQGSIVYNAKLNRYLYTSWTEYTFEFYEAPTPWGPWKLFLSRDFGDYQWNGSVNGGYATTIPSKFISDDGKTMYVQSNTFSGGQTNYGFSLRKLFVEPFAASTPSNEKGTDNLATEANGARPFTRAGHAGPTMSLMDGKVTGSIDSWTNEAKTEDYWGIVWPRQYHINHVEYTTGNMFGNGGWFKSLRVQVRHDGAWTDVSNVFIAPVYPFSKDAGPNKTFAFDFDAIDGDGVRVIGQPGGETAFTSAAELTASYR